MNLERLRWYFNRLTAMSPGEVALRVGRVPSQWRERRQLDRGKQPGADARLLASRGWFDGQGDLLERWQERFAFDEAALERLDSDGSVNLFGTSYDLGSRPRWHVDPRTRRQAPVTFGKHINYRDEAIVGDIKTLWEPSRHQHLVPVAVAYAVTGRAEYRALLGRHLDSWLADNPYGYGVHWCSSLEVALRGIAWCMAHSIVVLRDGPSGILGLVEDSAQLERSLFQHCHFIDGYYSRYSSANNHLIGELAGLWALAGLFDFGEVSARWQHHAKAGLEAEFHKQVHADGVAREQAVHYQLELMEYAIFCWCVGEAVGLPLADSVLERIDAMWRFLCAITPPGGALPQLGDSDEGTVNRFTLAELPDPQQEMHELMDHVLGAKDVPGSEKAFWYGCLGRRSLPLRAPQEAALATAERFPEGGYAVLRRGRLQLVFDAGPLGFLSTAAHGHADALAFVLSSRERDWLIDPGTYAYHGEPAYRRYFRGTSAHNTLVVEGLDQSVQGGHFLWTRHANAVLEGCGDNETDRRSWAEGSHDGYERVGVCHRRRVSVDDDGRVLVADELSAKGGDRRPEIALYFHFAPDLTITLEKDQAVAEAPDGSERLLLALSPELAWRLERGQESPPLGWYSSGLGKKVPTFTLVGSGTASVSASSSWRVSTRLRIEEIRDIPMVNISPASHS